MPTKTRAQLKNYFLRNSIPNETNFADLIDSTLSQADDGVFKSGSEPLGVVAGTTDQKPALRLFASYPATNPDWTISLRPAQDPSKPTITRPGLGVADGAGALRLFVDTATGNVGVGTNTPVERLHVAGNVKAGRFVGEALELTATLKTPAGALRAADAGLRDELDRLNRTMPLGAVISWWRASAQIPLPAGFEVCDGRTLKSGEHAFLRQDGTPLAEAITLPDLRDAFILGADPTTQPGLPRGNEDTSAPGVGGKGGSNDLRSIDHGHTVSISHTHGATWTGDSSKGRTGPCTGQRTGTGGDHIHSVAEQSVAWKDNWNPGGQYPTLTDPKPLWVAFMPPHQTDTRGTHDHAIPNHDHDSQHNHTIAAMNHNGTSNSGPVTSGMKVMDVTPRYVGLLMLMRVR